MVMERTAMHLELGCGPDWVVGDPQAIGLDMIEPADVLSDLYQPLPFDDCSFDTAKAVDVLEHIRPERQYGLWNEIHRVLRPGGLFIAYVPASDLDANLALRDPTHVSFWVRDSILYFTEPLDSNLGRQAARAGRTAEWEVVDFGVPKDVPGYWCFVIKRPGDEAILPAPQPGLAE